MILGLQQSSVLILSAQPAAPCQRSEIQAEPVHWIGTAERLLRHHGWEWRIGYWLDTRLLDLGDFVDRGRSHLGDSFLMLTDRSMRLRLNQGPLHYLWRFKGWLLPCGGDRVRFPGRHHLGSFGHGLLWTDQGLRRWFRHPRGRSSRFGRLLLEHLDQRHVPLKEILYRLRSHLGYQQHRDGHGDSVQSDRYRPSPSEQPTFERPNHLITIFATVFTGRRHRLVFPQARFIS